MDSIEYFVQVAQEKWPVIATFIAVSLVAMFLQTAVVSRSTWTKIPLIGAELGSDEKRRELYLKGAKRVYTEGYKRFKNGVYRIVTPTSSKVIVVSTRFLPELRKLPDSILSRDAAIVETLHSKYTGISPGEMAMSWVLKARLTPALNRVNLNLADEVQSAFREEMPTCEDWTAVKINSVLLRIVAKASGRIFVGPELCHSEEYLEAAIRYTVEVIGAANAVSNVPPWLRSFKASKLPEVQRLHERRKHAIKFMQPVVESRKDLDQKPDDLLQWLIDNEGNLGDMSTWKLARTQLALSFAAIHTSTVVSTNVFYTLAVMPNEVILELRDEIRSVLGENNGNFTSSALQSMKKVDSFIKETMRYYPFANHSFERKVMRTFTLSNGQVIPAGVILECSTAHNQDDEVFPDASRFDPWRFSKLQEQEKEDGMDGAARHQMVSVTPNHLTFGYGRHACPGRFFAINEIKMIIGTFLLNYDIKNIDGSNERYANVVHGSSSVPDVTKELLFRRV
ncbi:hypothetical protein M406DRAFT_88222 [Cryphonectria parasitica EP155]|uniref:Cytochrome P450 monooxygenase n=1 Tax=Cryphonectria parasitica (strain ATCC 38755 / EP155) TaxID=660469 RepID=A0A9P5CNN0_CRYP1|nr:uncharacterized protein M406DRAFT_88222 [Cryphonectria parasitica EP155]KAF3765318.1 hypothetical protein M406DRAFT_88222 [Cryphonectria parasitica EP155]